MVDSYIARRKNEAIINTFLMGNVHLEGDRRSEKKLFGFTIFG